MISVKRFYDPKLAQVSYLIGSTDTRSAVIIDANRDVEQYIRSATEEGLAITHVTETHIHADFISGSRELAARTGAQLYLSDEGDAGWKYAFAAETGAVEFAGGHVPGARNLPLGDLSDSLHALPADRPIIVHCQGGARSAIAASLLDAHGFSQVRNLAGGFNEWMSAGHPVDTGVAVRPSSLG